MNELAEKKNYKECRRLRPQMVRVSSAAGQLKTDGPFAETKEVFSGIFLMEAESFDAAVKLAQSCPMLGKGESIMVMPVQNGKGEQS